MVYFPSPGPYAFLGLCSFLLGSLINPDDFGAFLGLSDLGDFGAFSGRGA